MYKKMATFIFKNKKINYEVNGNGKPLLILNGIMMSTNSWQPFISAFSNYQLIRVDFFDQGKTDELIEDYTQDVQVELVFALLQHLNIDKINIVGISYGGEVALLFSLKYQKYIDKLIIFNSVVKTSEKLKKIGHQWNEYAKSKDPYKYYDATIPVIYSTTFKENNKKWMENRKELLCSTVFKDEVFLEKMIRLTNSAENFNVEEKISNLKIPVLVVASEEDELTPPSEQRLLASLIKNSKLVIMPKVGHASMYEDPQLFTALIIGFIEVDFNMKVL